MKLVRRNLLAIIPAAFLAIFASSAQAAIGPTIKATKLGQKIVFQGYTYTVVKLKGKLVWKKGAKVVASSPSAQPSATAKPTATASATPTATASALTFVAKVNDIGVGHTKIVEIKPASGPSFSVAVTRSTSAVIVLSAVCTHQGCTVEVAASELSCPCHGSAYNWTTGAVNQGPAQVALKKFAVTEDAGAIFIKL